MSEDYTGRDLAGADLRGADLRGSTLVLADLSGVDLTGADLTGADCGGACFVDAQMDGVIVGPGTQLDGALLVGTGLTGPRSVTTGTRSAWRSARETVLGLVSRAAAVDADDALDELDRADLAMGTWAWAWSYVGRRLEGVHNDEAALDVLITAVVLSPDPVTRMAFARVLLRRGDLGAAAPALRRLRRERPEDGHIAAQLGYVLGRLGQHEQAVEALERAIELGHRDANTWSALGMVCAGRGDAARAVQAFEAAASSGVPLHVANLARHHVRHGDPVAAAAALEDAPSPNLAELKTTVEAMLGGAGGAALPPGAAPRAPPASPVPLPVSAGMIDQFRQQHPYIAPIPQHLFFASPHGIGLLFGAVGGPRLVWAGSGGLELAADCPVGPATAQQQAAVLVARAMKAAPAASGLPLLFDGRCPADELTHLLGPAPKALRDRVEAFGALLQTRWDVGPDAVLGDAVVVDALVPDSVFVGADGRAGPFVPDAARRRGSQLWNVAQTVAWLGIDRGRFVSHGAWERTPQFHVLRVQLHLSERQATGLALLVWSRWFLGLAALWPLRRGRFLARFLEVMEAAETA